MIPDAYFSRFETKKYRNENPVQRALIRRCRRKTHSMPPGTLRGAASPVIVSCGVRSIVLSECATSNLPTPIGQRHSWIGSSLPPGLAISMTGFTNTMR